MEEWYFVHMKTRGDLGFVDFLFERVVNRPGGDCYSRKGVTDTLSSMISKFHRDRDALN